MCAMVVAGLLGLTMLPGGAMVLAGGSSKNCEEKLVGQAFLCKVVGQSGNSGEAALDFTSGTLGDFDLTFEDGDTYGCSCRADGDLDDPEFDQEEDGFLCAGTVASGPAVLVGRLKDDGKIKAEEIQTAFTPTNSLLYKCKKI